MPESGHEAGAPCENYQVVSGFYPVETGVNRESSRRNYENRKRHHTFYEDSPPQGPSRGTAGQFPAPRTTA
jgi:hypothetical protein